MTEVIVQVNGQNLAGWLDSRISRSMDSIAAGFSARVNWQPGLARPLKRQDKVTVLMGNTPLMTGWVLMADPTYNRKDGVSLKVQARALTGDLIVASAIHQGGQWRNATVLQVARDLCQPFRFAVSADVDVGEPLNLFELNTGETVMQALSRACAYRALLPMSDTRGGLLLTRAGTRPSEAAIVAGDGGNVISMEPMGSDAQRCAEYIVKGQSPVNLFMDVAKAADVEGRATDPFINRYLPLMISANEGGKPADMQALAEHTARIRMGRANGYRYTVEGWEVNGSPWLENTLVPVYDPAINADGEKWLIVEVTAKVDRKDGDVAELLVRPPDAYRLRPLPEPAIGGGLFQ